MATTPTPPLTNDASDDSGFGLMLGVLWRLSKGHRICPWRSPYLRWRIETYSGLHAERIEARDFWRFAWTNRRELVRFLRWAERMDAARQPHG